LHQDEIMSLINVRHYNLIDVDRDLFGNQTWRERWPNFQPYELCSPDTKALKISTEFLDALQRVRIRFDRFMNMTSVYRTEAHNRRVGGVTGSQHVKGLAGDCALLRPSHGPLLERLAREEGMTGIGRYPKKRFIHMDMRPGKSATWGRWQ
jgi:peptidase M15-like protein